MLKHYVKIFFRNLGRYKLYSAINFASLVLGISFSFLVYLFITNALPDDRFHQNYDTIYQLDGVVNEGIQRYWPMGVLDYVREEMPEVETAYTYGEINILDLRVGNREFRERALYASPGFFQVLSFDLADGNPRRALEQRNGVYLTRAKARKLFDEASPVGETLEIYLGGDYHELYVAGIVEDYPLVSSIKPDLVLSSAFVQQSRGCVDSSGRECTQQVFLHLSQAGAESVRNRAEGLAGDLNVRFSLSGQVRLESLRLTSPWFDARSRLYMNPFILGMGLLCLLILGISCVTYINNTVAATATRFREIGIRKVMGSDRRHIALQFMAESAFSVLVAMALSLLVVEALLPVLNPHINSLIPFDFTLSSYPLYQARVLPLFGVLAGLTALMAGFWPAAVLSRFKPSTVLKPGRAMGATPSFSRYLVGFQMVVALIVFVLALHTEQSLSAMNEDYYHYRDDSLVRVPVTESTDGTGRVGIYPAFRQSMEREGMGYPIAGLRALSQEKNLQVEGQSFTVYMGEVTRSWFGLTEMHVSEKSDVLDRAILRDSAYVVINPVLRDQMGWQDGLGRQLELDGIPHTVVGVLEEFHGYEGGEQRVPFAFRIIPESKATWAYVDTSPSGQPKAKTAAEIESVREALMRQDRPMSVGTEVRFASGELIMEWITGWSLPVVIFALGLTFLGLFSLTSFSVNRRLKEISIRKVNGAMPGELVRLLGWDYVKLGAVAVLIALPLGYMASNKLVSGFARVSSPGSFLTLFMLTVAFMLTFILLCVGWQVWKASNVNPVRYLKEDQ